MVAPRPSWSDAVAESGVAAVALLTFTGVVALIYALLEAFARHPNWFVLPMLVAVTWWDYRGDRYAVSELATQDVTEM